MSVTTSPKGSYREEHVLAYLERHLEPWSADRRWRILLTDAYAAHMGDNIRRLAWHRGYIVILHGGGTTGAMQVNDTDLHQHLRRLYVEEEQNFLLARNRAVPGQLVTPRPSDCIQWAATIWRRTSLHIRGSGGFKSVGAAVALDGSEDHLVTREAKQVWDDVNMRSAREEALHGVATEFRAGRLQWMFNQVYELACDYPWRGALDGLEELQDDEDPVDGVPWCEGDALEDDCAVGASDRDTAHEEGHTPAVAGDGEGLEDAAPAQAARWRRTALKEPGAATPPTRRATHPRSRGMERALRMPRQRRRHRPVATLLLAQPRQRSFPSRTPTQRKITTAVWQPCFG